MEHQKLFYCTNSILIFLFHFTIPSRPVDKLKGNLPHRRCGRIGTIKCLGITFHGNKCYKQFIHSSEDDHLGIETRVKIKVKCVLICGKIVNKTTPLFDMLYSSRERYGTHV